MSVGGIVMLRIEWVGVIGWIVVIFLIFLVL